MPVPRLLEQPARPLTLSPKRKRLKTHPLDGASRRRARVCIRAKDDPASPVGSPRDTIAGPQDTIRVLFPGSGTSFVHFRSFTGERSGNEVHPFDCRRMQPGVTVVLATVWLAVYAAVVGTSTLHPYRLALDQYSPLAPRRHGVHRRVGGRPAWRDQNPAENQPLDLSIYPRRSITTGTGTSGIRYISNLILSLWLPRQKQRRPTSTAGIYRSG